MAKAKEVSEQVVFPDPEPPVQAQSLPSEAPAVSLNESIARQLKSAIETSGASVAMARSQVGIAEAAHNKNLGMQSYADQIGNQDGNSPAYQRLLEAVQKSAEMLLMQQSQLEAVEAAHNKNLGMQLFVDQLAAQGVGFAPLQQQ